MASVELAVLASNRVFTEQGEVVQKWRNPPCHTDRPYCANQPYCIALRAAARIFSTLGRNFISSLNNGMCVS